MSFAFIFWLISGHLGMQLHDPMATGEYQFFSIAGHILCCWNYGWVQGRYSNDSKSVFSLSLRTPSWVPKWTTRIWIANFRPEICLAWTPDWFPAPSFEFKWASSCGGDAFWFSNFQTQWQRPCFQPYKSSELSGTGIWLGWWLRNAPQLKMHERKGSDQVCPEFHWAQTKKFVLCWSFEALEFLNLIFFFVLLQVAPNFDWEWANQFFSVLFATSETSLCNWNIHVSPELLFSFCQVLWDCNRFSYLPHKKGLTSCSSFPSGFSLFTFFFC